MLDESGRAHVLLVATPGAIDAVLDASDAISNVVVRPVIGDVGEAIEATRAADREAALVVVVEGKNAALDARARGADETLESDQVSREMVHFAVRLASERARQRIFKEDIERALAHRERLAALGTVVAGVAHEINGPAAAVRVNLEGVARSVRDLHDRLDVLAATLERGASADDARREIVAMRDALVRDEVSLSLDDSLGAVRAILDVARDLKGVARSSSAEAPPEVVDLRRVVMQVLRLASVTSHESMHVEIDFPDDVPLLWLPRTRLVQIVTNLVSNAVGAMSATPRPLHRLRVALRSDETSLMLAISDSGVGIPPEDLDRVFEPFFTRGSLSGTGLGLSMSREIVRSLGGELTIDSVRGEGTTAMIFLPLALRTQAKNERVLSTSIAPADVRRPRVLLVDADDRTLATTHRLLRHRVDVVLARGSVGALGMIVDGSQIDAVVCRAELPEIDGYALHEEVRARAPALTNRFVVLSQDAHGEVARRFAKETGVAVVGVGDERGLVAAVKRVVA